MCVCRPVISHVVANTCSDDYGALEPSISGKIMELHHDKHHQTYVTSLNNFSEQMAEAKQKEDIKAQIALQPLINFHGGAENTASSGPRSRLMTLLQAATSTTPCFGRIWRRSRRAVASRQPVSCLKPSTTATVAWML
jgi:hypothetical protein